MKQYMLSVHSAEGQQLPSPEEVQQTYADVDAFNAELRAEGAWVFGGGLHPPASATVVRVQGGEVLTIDGPFAETKEHLGGFWVIKAADLDAALAWAAKAAAGRAARSQGLTNRQIAQALFVSMKAVSTHLGHGPAGALASCCAFDLVARRNSLVLV